MPYLLVRGRFNWIKAAEANLHRGYGAIEDVLGGADAAKRISGFGRGRTRGVEGIITLKIYRRNRRLLLEEMTKQNMISPVQHIAFIHAFIKHLNPEHRTARTTASTIDC